MSNPGSKAEADAENAERFFEYCEKFAEDDSSSPSGCLYIPMDLFKIPNGKP